jgi:hypothetical protein
MFAIRKQNTSTNNNLSFNETTPKASTQGEIAIDYIDSPYLVFQNDAKAEAQNLSASKNFKHHEASQGECSTSCQVSNFLSD